MKNLSENKEQSWYLVEEWTTKVGLQARVHKCVWADKVKTIAPSLHDFYTGYVQPPEDDKNDYYNSELEVHGGVTWDGVFSGIDVPGRWVGFAMAHVGDEHEQSLDYAKDQCEQLAAQIANKNDTIKN